MQCHNCGSDKATFRLTQVVDDETRTVHLCEACAGEQGIHEASVPENFPLSDLLSGLGLAGLSQEPAEKGPESCAFCGLTAREFRESGRLGCPQCWSSFEVHLRGLLRRVHGSTQHIGKVYLPPDPSVSLLGKRLSELRRKLHRAVEMEDFERAAALRDEIRSLEPMT